MKVLDPTYLRYVYDCIQTGIISSENPSLLPNGLVGVYEEVLNSSTLVKERCKLLDFFSVWALLKKEVSVSLIIPIISDWNEEHLLGCLSAYSKWFNSPVSGKFQLYHERFRVFIMQRTTAEKIKFYNSRIIHHCREALSEKPNSEWELYALEYLSTHLLLPAMEECNNDSLKTLAYDTKFWNRQLEVSKDYDWTKKMHNEMMLWASKYDDDQVIECALKKVDLYHLEQNDAPRIVEMVAQNDIEIALERITSFGGNDKEGLQRKFLLYMLCLMEVTILDSKDKDFCDSAIDHLLKHLGENLDAEHLLYNWNEYFPEHLMYEVIKSIEEKGLKVDVLLNLFPSTENIEEYKNNSNFKNNLAAIQNISVVCVRVYLYIQLIKKLIATNKPKTAKNVFWYLSRTIDDIPYTFEKTLNILLLNSLFNDYFLDDESYGLVSSLEECKSFLDKNQLKYVEGKQSNMDYTGLIELANNLKNPYDKILIHCDLVRNYLQFYDTINPSEIINKASEIFSSTDLFWNKYLVLVNLLLECIITNNMHLFYELSKSLKTESIDENTGDVLERYKIFKDILSLLKLEAKSDIKNYYYYFVEYNFGVKNEYEIQKLMANITAGYLKLNKINPALRISNYSSQWYIYEQINSLLREGFLYEVQEFIKKYVPDILKVKARYEVLRNISLNCFKTKKYDQYHFFWNEAILAADIIETLSEKCLAYIDIAKELSLLSDFETSEAFLKKAYLFSKDIDYKKDKIDCYILISDLFYMLGNKSESQRILIEAFEIETESLLKEDNCLRLIKFSSLYYKYEDFINADIYLHNALVEAKNGGEDDYELQKNLSALCSIAVELAISNRMVILYNVLDEIYNIYQAIQEYPYKYWAFNSLINSYSQIVEELFKRDLYAETLSIFNTVNDNKIKNKIFQKIAQELTRNAKYREAIEIIKTISNINLQIDCFMDFGKYLINENSSYDILSILKGLENSNITDLIMKGVLNKLTPSKIDKEICRAGIIKYINDESTLEYILLQYFLKQLFYNNLDEINIQKFKNTLNVQWAIDIKKNS